MAKKGSKKSTETQEITENLTIKQLAKELAKSGLPIKTADEVIVEPKVKTDILALDYVLDGGIAIGEGGHRIEFYGAESTAKSTFCLYIIRKYQSLGKKCVFIDGEESYDRDWAEYNGVDNNELLICKPYTLEELGDTLVQIIPQVDLIVIDSIVSFIPEFEQENVTSKEQMALQARVNALITRKIYHAIRGKNTTIIFINQEREKVGIMFGNPKTTGGGHALKHLYNTRLEFKTGKSIVGEVGDEKEKVGVEINLNCVKNKKGVPHRTACLDFYFNGYVDNKKTILLQALKFSIIQKSGGWYTFKDRKEQGLDSIKNSITDEEYKEIEKEIWERLR